MNRRCFSIIFVVLGISAQSLFAQRPFGPPMPFVDKGACPFECCTYRQWNVEKPTVIRVSMSDSSRVLYRLKAGEKVQGVTGIVITTKPGIVNVLKNTTLQNTRLRKGDQLFMLTNLGEGFSKIWYKGRIFEGDPYDSDTFKTVRESEAVWWVKIKNRRGQIGWSRQPENFGNIDQCG